MTSNINGAPNNIIKEFNIGGEHFALLYFLDLLHDFHEKKNRPEKFKNLENKYKALYNDYVKSLFNHDFEDAIKSGIKIIADKLNISLYDSSLSAGPNLLENNCENILKKLKDMARGAENEPSIKKLHEWINNIYNSHKPQELTKDYFEFITKDKLMEKGGKYKINEYSEVKHYFFAQQHSGLEPRPWRPGPAMRPGTIDKIPLFLTDTKGSDLTVKHIIKVINCNNTLDPGNQYRMTLDQGLESILDEYIDNVEQKTKYLLDISKYDYTLNIKTGKTTEAQIKYNCEYFPLFDIDSYSKFSKKKVMHTKKIHIFQNYIVK